MMLIEGYLGLRYKGMIRIKVTSTCHLIDGAFRVSRLLFQK